MCYRCGGAFVITKKSLRSKRMHCEECTRGKYNKVKVKESELKEVIPSGLDLEIDKLLSDIKEHEAKDEIIGE